MNQTSTSQKRSFWGFFSGILDLLFPPFCLNCEKESPFKHFCSECWNQCIPPDPVDRCRYCFEPVGPRESICPQCLFKPDLHIERAYVFEPHSPMELLSVHQSKGIAGFALYQWVQLEWPLPDAVVPMPDADSKQFAQDFSMLLNVPLIHALGRSLSYKEDRIVEDQTLLLFDAKNRTQEEQKAALALRESFPKRIYLLKLFPTSIFDENRITP